MASTSVTPALLQILNTGFKNAFLKGLERAKTLWNQIAMEITSTNASEVYPILGRFPTLREWIGNRVVRDLTISDFQIKNKPYEGTVRVPRPAIEDDSYGIYGTEAEMLGDAANRFPDKLIATLLEAGFVNKGYDGVAFFATTHPDGNGGTQSNKGTTAFSSAALAAAIAQMRSLKDEGGEFLDIANDPTKLILVYHPSIEETVRNVLNADTVANTAGTAGISNVWKGAAVPMAWGRLTDTNDWYLIDAGKVLQAFIWQSRKKPQLVAKTSLTDDNVFSRNEFVWGVDLRGNAGYGLWQLAFGAHV